MILLTGKPTGNSDRKPSGFFPVFPPSPVGGGKQENRGQKFRSGQETGKQEGNVDAAASRTFTAACRTAAPPLRRPDPDESPLSREEVRFGRSHGLIRTDRARAFAGGKTR